MPGGIFFAVHKTTPPAPITLDSNEIVGGVTLDEDNLIAYGDGSGVDAIPAALGYQSGKRYFEFEYTQMLGSKQVLVGIEPSPFQIEFPITGGCHYGAWGSGRIDKNGAYYSVSAPASVTGDIIGVAVDFDNLKAFWSRNNVWMSLSGDSSDPVTGVDPIFTLLDSTYYYPAIVWYYNNSRVKLYTTVTNYSPPTGYTNWGL